DGNLDLILRSRLGPQARISQNNCGTGKPVMAVKLRGVQSNRDSIGAKVEVNGRVQFVTAGSGYLSQHTKTLHFALVDEQRAEAKITWPSGRQQTIANLAAGHIYEIIEGSSDPKPTPFRLRANWPSGTITPQNVPEPVDVWLLEPVPLPDYHRGPGFLLLYFGTAPATAPGLPIEAVNVDKAPPDFAAQYSLFRRYLFEYRRDLELPLLLLIDDQSRAHKIYATIPDATTLRGDLKLLGDPDRAARALPFPGRYYQQPHRNYFKLGAAFYWAGYPDQALPYLDEVVRRAPDNWKAFYAIAEIHFESARYSQAIENYRKTLAARPDYGPALLGAGESLMRLKDFPGAEKMLQAALDATPKNADAANQFGLLRVQQNRTAEAKQWFERAIEFQKDHSGAINNLGVLYMNLGQPNDAIAAFEFGIEQSPDDDQLYLNLGRVYITLRQPERARATMQRLLARKPGDPVATRALADLSNR
ncbi:MAG: tetratricopeptide repeat protein, partial [Bryobacteraceae bacterium]